MIQDFMTWVVLDYIGWKLSLGIGITILILALLRLFVWMIVSQITVRGGLPPPNVFIN